MIWNLICIAVIMVIIIDVAQFPQEISRTISRMITKGRIEKDDIFEKPFTCSFCMSWWLNLIYIIIIGKLSILNITLCLIISTLTPVIYQLIITIKDRLIWIIKKIGL